MTKFHGYENMNLWLCRQKYIDRLLFFNDFAEELFESEYFLI